METNIPIEQIPVKFSKNGTDYDCTVSNLSTSNCKTNPVTSDDTKGCIAHCHGLTPNPYVKFILNTGVPLSNNLRTPGMLNNILPSYSQIPGGWSNNTANDGSLVNPIKPFFSSPILFSDADNTNISCRIINANSDNCKTKDSFGCKAYCSKPDNTGFVIEQKCKSSPTSCDKSDLTWIKI
jgi:hypothetical protein